MLRDYDILRVFASYEGVQDQITFVDDDEVENEFNIETWKSITERLLEKSSSSEVQVEVPEKVNKIPSLVERKSGFRNFDFGDRVFTIAFSNFFSQITYRKIDKFEFNRTKYGEVWKSVFDLYKSLSADHSSYETIKTWINWSFGAVNNGISGIRCSFDYQSSIKSKANSILNEIQSMFGESFIYMDVDEMYFLNENKEKILKYTDSLELDYDTFEWQRFLFVDEKRIVGVDDQGDFRFRGFANYEKIKST